MSNFCKACLLRPRLLARTRHLTKFSYQWLSQLELPELSSIVFFVSSSYELSPILVAARVKVKAKDICWPYKCGVPLKLEASGQRALLYSSHQHPIDAVSMASRGFKCKDEPTLGDQVATTQTLLHLSTEVLIEILGYLPAADMISVQRTCRTIRDIITGTAYLQYILRAGINGVEDFLLPGASYSYSERLELLRRHEQSWDSLRFDLFTKCAFSSGYIPSLTLQDGYLINRHFESEGGLLRYEYTDLCSAACNEDLRWVHVTIRETGYTPEFTRPMAVFAVDQDLVAILRFFVLSNSFLCAKPDESQQSAKRPFYHPITDYFFRIHDGCTSSPLINTYGVTPAAFRGCGKRRSPG